MAFRKTPPSGALRSGALRPGEAADTDTFRPRIRMETPGRHDQEHRRFEFVTRRWPYRIGVAPRLIARTAPIRRLDEHVLELLGVQMITFFSITEMSPSTDGIAVQPPNGLTSTRYLDFLAFVEPPSYEWDRLQTLCERFESRGHRGRRTRGPTRGRKGGGSSRRSLSRPRSRQCEGPRRQVAPAQRRRANRLPKCALRDVICNPKPAGLRISRRSGHFQSVEVERQVGSLVIGGSAGGDVLGWVR